MSKKSELVERDVIELVRVSTNAQAGEDRGGVPAQRQACREIATRNGLNPRWKIDIIGVSGAAIMQSPEMVQLQNIVKSGKCAGVVIREVSRLMRPEDFTDYAILEVLRENGVRVFTESGDFDLTNPSGRFMMTMFAGVAGLERFTIRDRATRGREELRKMGIPVCAPHSLPYGILYTKGKKIPGRPRGQGVWSLDPVKIERVRRLFRLFVSGETNFRKLAKQVGINYFSIRDILKHPIYSGWYVIDTMRDPNEKPRTDARGRYMDRRRIPRPPDKCYRTKVFADPPVPAEDYAQAQRMLEAKDRMRWRRNVDGPDPFLFRGLLRCAECGSLMITLRHCKSHGEHPRDYYICQRAHGDRGGIDSKSYTWRWRIKNKSCGARRMRREKLDEILDNLIDTKIADPAYLTKLMEDQSKDVEKTDCRKRIETLERELKTLDDRRKRLREFCLDRDLEMSMSEYKSRNEELVAQQVSIRIELSKIKPEKPTFSPDYLATMVYPYHSWPYLKAAQKRALLLQTIPVFNVSTSKEARRGDLRTTEYIVNGFFMMFDGERMEAKTVVSARDSRRGKRAGTRINRGRKQVVSNKLQVRTDLVTDHSKTGESSVIDPAAFLPQATGNSRSIYFNLTA